MEPSSGTRSDTSKVRSALRSGTPLPIFLIILCFVFFNICACFGFFNTGCGCEMFAAGAIVALSVVDSSMRRFSFTIGKWFNCGDVGAFAPHDAAGIDITGRNVKSKHNKR